MGLIQNGQWVDKGYSSNDGEFHRQDSAFRHWISPGEGEFPAQSGRYHLYVSLACPWAHRTLIMRNLKGLEQHISLSIVAPLMLENGWQFSAEWPEPLYGHQYLYQLYLQASSTYEGRVTVPVLFDKQTRQIVNNESADIIRIFNSSFDQITGNTRDYYPTHLRETIDRINQRVYEEVNNGVYRAGFATTQKAYESAVTRLFGALDWLDTHLGQNRYLAGDQLTEADWRLFTTLVRFDPVYFGHFKCNIRSLAHYHNLQGYLQELYQIPDVAQTTSIDHIKQHYYGSHPGINKCGIVPLGPIINLDAPHGRDAIASHHP